MTATPAGVAVRMPVPLTAGIRPAARGRGPSQPVLPVPCPVMGAIKPWHISVLCCLVVTAVLVVGLLVFLSKRNNRR